LSHAKRAFLPFYTTKDAIVGRLCVKIRITAETANEAPANAGGDNNRHEKVTDDLLGSSV
jgi:hypothetical protein